MLGLLPQADWPLGALKLIVVWLLVLLAGATVGQLIARVAQRGRAIAMTVAWAFDAILAATVLAVAGWTIVARDAFAAVVGFVAYGLLLALVWVRLAAPDVALTEAAIGGGVTGVLLLGAAARLRGVGGRAGRYGRPRALRLAAGAALRRGRGGARGRRAAAARSRPDARAAGGWRACRRPASAIRSPAC